MPLLLLVLAAIAGGLFLYSRSAEGETMKADEDIFERNASKYGLDADLLRAIAYVESNMDANAVHWEPPNDVSIGLMQILCVPPRGTPRGEDYVCQNKFNIIGWPATFASLKNSETNVDLAAQILSYNLRTYGFPRGVAVYNDFRSRHSGVSGPFPNDAYVDKVVNRLTILKGTA